MKSQFRTMMRIAVVFLIIASTYGVVQSQVVAVTAGGFTKVGLTGGQFLKIGVGARGTGMAGAVSGLSSDVTSVFWNPAGLADIRGYAADVSHSFWFAGMSHSFAGAVIPVGERFRVGASFTTFSSGDIRVTTTNNPEASGGIYNVSDIAIGLSVAGYLTDQFSFGATAKYVQHAFTNVSAVGFVFDIGTKYNTGYRGITLGFGVLSLGPKQEFSGANLNTTNQPITGLNASAIDMSISTAPFNIPLSFRAGLGLDMLTLLVEIPEIDDDGTQVHKWATGIDFETYSDSPEQFAIGTEYTFRDLVILRAGYRFGNDQFGLAGGIGLKYLSADFDGRIDFSVNPTQNLGLINRLSVSMRFN
jgi:hypothetical protein